MNLVIGIVIIACLFLSETGARESVDNLPMRLTAVMLLTFSVPALALFQTIFVSRYWNIGGLPHSRQDSMLKRMSVCHSAVWLVASLMVITSTGWHSIVRENWGLSRLPLIDEILIILPMLFSLIVSWAVFYELQREISKKEISNGTAADTQTRKQTWYSIVTDPARLQYVGIRVRVYLLMALVPVILFVVLRDLSNPALVSRTVTGVALIAVTMFILLGFPFLLCRIWKIRAIDDAQLYQRLTNFCRREKLMVRDVRVWDTGGQIVNAMVVGMVPGFRMILISDGLLRHFPEHEIQAILRHEAGHIRLMHLPVRVMFVLLPLFVVAALESCGYSIPDSIGTLAVNSGLPGGFAWMVAPIAYGAFVVISLGWLSRKMEFEADQFAAVDNNQLVSENDGTVALLDALKRLAKLDPAKAAKPTLMHPGLLERIARIRQLIGQRNRELPLPLITNRTATNRVSLNNRIFFGVCLSAVAVFGLIIVSIKVLI